MHRRRDRGGPATLHRTYIWNTGLPIAELDPAFEGGSALTDLPPSNPAYNLPFCYFPGGKIFTLEGKAVWPNRLRP
jgi:hypothetical protein